jgi:hypothetical protein
MTEASIQEPAAAKREKVDARLWQDPFTAVERELTKSGKGDLEQPCAVKPSEHCDSPLTRKDNEALVIGVTMSAAPYAEDAEHRRRTRYAVLAGLERARFAPIDSRHIGYFLWNPTDDAVSHGLVPTRVSEGPAHSLPPQPQPSLRLYRERIERRQLGNVAAPTVVPYEWFQELPQSSSSNEHQNTAILVLWLEEEAFRGTPLKKISELEQFLFARGNGSKNKDEQIIQIIGPYSSDMLRDMVSEATQEKTINQFNLDNVHFYAYGASTPDDMLLKNLTFNTNLHGFFEHFGIHLERTVASDETLAGGIANELRRRGIKPGPDGDAHLALISEWDTFYGQTLPEAVAAQFPPSTSRCRDDVGCQRIHKLTFLRGLDGQVPLAVEPEDRKQDKTTTQAEKKTSAVDFFKTQTDTKDSDRPVGQGQFDYLRRIGERMHEIDKDLRKQNGKLNAVGILGSDVFDKLLVLRALRPKFPEALFFTTDFDEAYTMDSELPWTRNLIISSSFGPSLNDKLQGEIPPFRDSYQTSAFLATQLAIGDYCNTRKVSTKHLAQQLTVPRIFEIERDGHVLPFASPTPENNDGDFSQDLRSCNNHSLEQAKSVPGRTKKMRQAKDLKLASDSGGFKHTLVTDMQTMRSVAETSEPLTKSVNIQPDPDSERLFPTYEHSSRIILTGGLASTAAFVLASLFFGKVRNNAGVEIVLVFLGLAASTLICAYWDQFAASLTQGGEGDVDGEPLAILQGVSVWPTVLLRFLGILLALYFIWRAQSGLHKNIASIADEMHLDPLDNHSLLDKITRFFPNISKEIACLFRERRSFSICLFLWHKLASALDLSLGRNQTDPKASVNIQVSWKAYVNQEQFWRRFVRAFLCTLLMFAFAFFVLTPLFGQAIAFTRSELAQKAYWRTTIPLVLLMQFLTFFVLDATLCCLLFVTKLKGAKAEWPQGTTDHFSRLLRLQGDCVSEWIALNFVAKRTGSIVRLIYYPFVLIALLILSRSNLFANYAPSLTIYIALGISLSIVFGCAIMLCWAAKAARETAIENLTDEIIFAKGRCTRDIKSCSGAVRRSTGNNPRYAEQLETLLNRVDRLKAGAFSPFSQQPLVRAVLLPLGSFGWTALVENGILPGL